MELGQQPAARAPQNSYSGCFHHGDSTASTHAFVYVRRSPASQRVPTSIFGKWADLKRVANRPTPARTDKPCVAYKLSQLLKLSQLFSQYTIGHYIIERGLH